LLLGLPVSVLGGVFGGGMHCGLQNAQRVLAFERDVLGLDVQVPPEPGAALETPGAPASPATPARPTSTPPADPPASVAPPPPPPVVTAPAPVPAGPEPPGLPVARPEPVEDEELAARLATLRTVTVKVLVDPGLVDGNGRWLADVQRLVLAASSTYRTLVGIELSLVGVGRWPINTSALGPEQLREDLRARPREGADVLIGLTDREDPNGGAAPSDGERHGAYAVVFAQRRDEHAHLRPLLRELGHLLGAEDIDDPQAEAYQRGSFMSSAPVPAGSAPWLDAENRRRILERKEQAFEEEP
jgi:hypothetical protein